MKIFLLDLFFLLTIQSLSAQKFTYATDGSLWEKESANNKNNIIGKIGNRYLIQIQSIVNVFSHYYFRDTLYQKKENHFYLYDSNMQLISVEKAKTPDNATVLYSMCNPKFAYMFYQYTQDSSVFLSATKFDSSGKITGDPVKLIEGNLAKNYFRNGYSRYNYNIISSEDKSKIAIYTIGYLEDSQILTVLIFNQKLEKIYEKSFKIPKLNPNELIQEFNINNAGDFIFLKFSGSPAKCLLHYIKLNSDDIQYYDVTPLKVRLNHVNLYSDNPEGKIHIYSIYVDSSLNVYSNDIPLENAKNKSGIFYMGWDINANDATDAQLIPFSNFIGTYADDQEFMAQPVQRLSVNNFFKKASGGFILQGNSTRNFYIDSTNYLETSSARPYYNPSLNKLYNSQDKTHNLFFISFNGMDSVSQFDYVDKFTSGGNMATVKTKEGIHYLVFHDIFNKKEGYGALSLMDDYLLNSSGKITKQISSNIGSFKIIASESKQVDDGELIFHYFFRKKLNFGKIEF